MKVNIIIALLVFSIGCQGKMKEVAIKARPLTEEEAMNEEISEIIVEEYMKKAGY